MKNSNLLLRGMHFTLALSLPFLLVALLSCQRAKEQKADLGPEADPAAVEEALNAATAGRSFDGIHKDQFVDYSITQRVENNETTMLIGTVGVSVASIEETPTQKKIIFRVDRMERKDDGGFDHKVTETDPWILSKTSSSSALLNATALGGRRPTLKELKAYSAGLRASAAPKKTTFHQLRVATGKVNAPDAVSTKPGCGGLAVCEMPVRYVRFDIVDWYSDTDYQKVSIDFAFSLAAPFMPLSTAYFDMMNGIMITDCRSSNIPIQDRKYYVRVCKQLENFQK
ncbi:MAG: hypothetical protein KF799_05040 [Bdellovibrionales bacterium]|nr:hypothetical protein [Bdellovibrionales bacterium]